MRFFKVIPAAARLVLGLSFLIGSCATAGAQAQQASGPAPYDTFVKDATLQDGLIPLVRKHGRVYFALAKTQLDKDFIETAVPSSGFGGLGPAPGEPYVAPARIVRFVRNDDNVIVRWPNTMTVTQPNSASEVSTRESLPNSVAAVVPIAAEDDKRVVIPADSLLGDVADLGRYFQNPDTINPLHAYRLDPSRSFFARTSAFPQNDVIRVDQTWTSVDPVTVDNAPDPRSLEIMMTYNLLEAPEDGYVPRLEDWRVGYFAQSFLNFASDDLTHRDLHYIIRWNFGPRPSAAPWTATHPIVYYLSNDIPPQYRAPLREALLAWNDAYRRIGILGAVQVHDQPSDPAWDPDDIRYNVVRWLDTSSPPYGAQGLIITDPRTGEELNVGVNLDAVMGLGANQYRYIVAPARGLPDTAANEFSFERDFVKAIMLHESGHDMGLMHNFIGSQAYTAKDLQSYAFTSRYGITSSVMEYDGLNLWPKGMPQGRFSQLVLGPYDYYAIRYGYAYTGARTPQAEIPELRRWASRWSEPWYRFASDEDTEFASGHAIDPRVVTNDLTNRPLQWCDTQISIMGALMDRVAQRFPASGRGYDDARRAFGAPLNKYLFCATLPAHTIGGEYLSRAASGDPRSVAPFTAVSRIQEEQAWQMLDRRLFADNAWHFNPAVLTRLVYPEGNELNGGGSWSYVRYPRHDMAVVQVVGNAQNTVLNELYAPLRLQRVDELSTKYAPGTTMTLTDLFDWSARGIYGDLVHDASREGVIRRNLQIAYTKRLGALWTAPAPGTPADAQALAHLHLEKLRSALALAMRAQQSELGRAHLEALDAIAVQALQAHATIDGS